MTTNAYDENQPIEARLRQFSDTGFRWIHWAEHLTSNKIYTRDEAERIAQMADKFNLCIDSIHGVYLLDEGRPFTEDRWLKLNINRIQFISWLGGNCIVVHVPLEDCELSFETECTQSERLIRRILPAAQNHSVRLAIENLDTRSCRRIFDYLFKTFSQDDLGFCFDSGHAHMNGEDDILERYLDRLRITHLHDNHGKEDEHLLPGAGTIAWKAVISSLKKLPDLESVNIEAFWPGEIPKDQWCRMAYQSIFNLWYGNRRQNN
jgi:sugar phosphate isomerase/epimerase